MDLSGSYFTYAGVSSRLYSLIFANCTTERTTALTGEIESNTISTRNGIRNYFIGDSYGNSTLSFEAEIISSNDTPMIPVMQRTVEKWLFYQPGYRRLYIDPADDLNGECTEVINGKTKHLYLNCRFINPNKLEYNGGVIGYRFTVECDSCMAWQDSVTYDYDIQNVNEDGSSLIQVEIDTDINDYTYPKVTIQVGSQGGDIRISNNTDDASRLTSFVGLAPHTNLILKGGDINYVSGDNYLKFYNRNFIRLLDGKNSLSVLGNVSHISFEFQNRRYI